MQSPLELSMRGESMHERIENLLEDYGEVQIRFDSGEEAELHRHNTDFLDEPMVKVLTAGEANWFNADKVEEVSIHYDYR